MPCSIVRPLLPALLLIAGLLPDPGSAMVLTGNVSADFAALAFVEVIDPVGDVDLPPAAPPWTTPGWDFERVLFHYDRTTDRLFVGLDFAGIAGDADGDGDEGGTAPWLAMLGGVDRPGLAGSEAVCIAFDLDLDGSYDLIAGTGALDDQHRVALFAGEGSLPAWAFGTTLPGHTGPHFHAPPAGDYELAIEQWSQLAEAQWGETCFGFQVYAGSGEDDGIGEDVLLGCICFECCDYAAAAQGAPADFGLLPARPNPFNPATVLGFTLPETGEATLAVYNLQGRQVRSLLSGLQPAGSQQLSVDASGLPSGLYIAALRQGALVSTTRLVLTR
jgi:hypothetical protein